MMAQSIWILLVRRVTRMIMRIEAANTTTCDDG